MSTEVKQSSNFWNCLISRIFRIIINSELADPIIKVAVPLAKTILASLGITAAASAVDAGIQQKIHGSGTTVLKMPNKEMNDIMKIAKTLIDSNILLKGVAKTITNETKEQKGGFLRELLGTLGAVLLGNLLSRKGIVIATYGKGIVRAGYGNKMDF